MIQKLTFLSLAMVMLFIGNMTFAQDNSAGRWNLPSTRANVGGVYSNLPSVNNYKGPTGTTRLYHTPMGDVLVPPNVIPFVTATATESEISASNMGGNTNEMYASWNSYGPAFYGTGFCLTTNGGATWTGNYNNMFPANNGGDPGTWIWPTGSTWAGRLGASDLNAAYTGCTGFYSTDNGATWVGQVTFTPSGSVDKNLSCVDDVVGSPYFGRAYTLWSNFSLAQPPIVAVFTSDGGATWTPSTGNVSPAPDGSHYCQGVDVQVGPGGVVYAVWAYNMSGSPFTEDYLGFAKSTNGGVTWTSGNNQAVNVNGIRTTALYNGIRADGFPRLAVDKSGGARNGWIYAVMSEKLTAPARDNSDICLSRSTDGGTTWSHTLVNGDASGNYNWHGSPAVDNNGVLAVGYYDTRNTTVPVTQYYLSFSNNGGSSFSDIQVSDHNFTPSPIPGLAGGYQGDYTGITYGNGKFWPFWADNSTGHYQTWTAGVSTVVLAHDYACGPFLSFPQSPLLTNTAYTIRTKVSNVGSSAESTVPVKFYVDGVLTNTTNLTLAVGGVDSVTNSWQTAVTGNHTLMYISALSTDLDRTNDTVRQTVNVLAALPSLCEQFATATFPPTSWTMTAGLWSYNTVSSYCQGTGSAMADFYNVVSGTYDLTTLTFPASLVGDSLFFSDAYATYQTENDQLQVMYSTNGGGTFTQLALLNGGVAGELVTAPPTTAVFAPTCTQWKRQKFLLPTGTNKIKFNGITAFGNELYIDSTCLKPALVGIANNNTGVPRIYSLEQNYPNPFNPTTVISYGLPKSGQVKLVVYDILGQTVMTLINNEFKEAGSYKINFNASNLASGVYFYRMDAGDFTSVKKMLLIK